METIPALIDWLSKNRRALHLEFCRFSYLEDWLPDFFDIRLDAKWNDQKIWGRSVSESEHASVLKSTMELLERLARLSRPSLGLSNFAAHTEEEAAKTNACLELVERDAILRHFHTDAPFHPFEISSLAEIFGSSTEKFLSQSRDRSVRWNFYLADSTYSDVSVLICTAAYHGKKIFGFGSSLGNPIDAIRKSLFECIQNLPALLGQITVDRVSLSEFYRKPTHSIADHLFLGLDLNYVIETNHLFEGIAKTGNKLINRRAFTLDDFELTQLSLPEGIFPPSATIHYVYASHPQLINLYAGLPPKVVNQHLPHFIG